ncbi:hypothetical protein VQ643_06110 [Pseudomonas sp. F1_0610]|uniref:hypothetical protein n=1 Tax=Pseudomonas sp. F1_0610 TaxID=3114284 RepID=UPI0039C123D3
MTNNALRKLSIRARFAVALTCFRTKLRQEGLHQDPAIRLFLKQLAHFTQAQRLDSWEAEILSLTNLKLNAEDTLKQIQHYNQIESTQLHKKSSNCLINQLTVQQYQSIKQQLQLLPEQLNNLLALCIMVGRNNLYAGIVKFSIETLEPMQKALELVPLPIHWEVLIQQYNFKDNDGWGKPFNYEHFVQVMKS